MGLGPSGTQPKSQEQDTVGISAPAHLPLRLRIPPCTCDHGNAPYQADGFQMERARVYGA